MEWNQGEPRVMGELAKMVGEKQETLAASEQSKDAEHLLVATIRNSEGFQT